ncbi:hypothetical protein SRB5_45900 [Streptomyces sp. RB5]|uniref:Endoglucanase n=1 Tax=Streptomyces smaragdinus TaxID=2585196 RepID=A0A7K0CMD2_9ACTN|nr:cellulase family glycosylhydrolase [Streptomyces smaragdinus]MQY14423.1 hypothetical protein [Streptomyces smaragdinus]
MRALTRAAAFLGAAAVLAGLWTAPPAAAAPTGIHVSAAGRVVEGDGSDLVLRGVSHAHTWYQTQTASFADIKAKGANAIRVVLASGQRWTKNDAADVGNVVNRCKQNKLICVLEVHDTTGYGEQAGAATLSQAADYWISVKSALQGQEDYVILNIGNEPYGNQGYEAWTADTKAAITKLRGAGFNNAIMVDAPNWGQDWAGVMRANAASVFAADPDRNTIFSIHMYGVYNTAAKVQDYLNAFVTAKLPLVVGEFGNMHSDGDPDEDAIMGTAQQLGLGYLGWSWSGNGGGVEYLDMVTAFDPAQLTPWGTRIFNGPNGIAATAKEAGIYGGGGDDDLVPPTTPGTPAASDVTSTGARLTWTASTDNVGVTGYDIVRVTGTTETPWSTSSTASATLTSLSPSTAYTFAVYARDAAGLRSPRSATVTFTTKSPDQNPGQCKVTYKKAGDWGSGFQGDVQIANTGTTAIDGWTLTWTFPGNQVIQNMWGGTPHQTGADVSVTPADYTRRIPAAGSVTLGFIANYSGTNSSPASFALNGQACTLG